MIKLFNEKRIEDAFALVLMNAFHRVADIFEYRILNEELEALVTEVTEPLRMKKLDVDFEDRNVGVDLIEVSGDSFPASYDVQRGRYYPRARVFYTFKIKSGNNELLSVKPKTDSVHEKIYASVTDRSFTIYYHTDYARKELSEEVKKDVKDWAERVIPSIKKMIQVINDEVENFNDTTLVNKITDLIAERKDELNKRDSQNDDLNDLDI